MAEAKKLSPVKDSEEVLNKTKALIQKDKQENNTKEETEELSPDPETLQKTDPQDNMKGPVSSLVQGAKEEIEENNKETKEEADKKKEENM